MLQVMLDILVNSLYETLSLFPYLFLTYLFMEYIEHTMSRNITIAIRKYKQYAPVLGGFLGTIPQCGFSVSASNLYRTGLITLGTMVAVFLSTSDEMIPILISGGTSGYFLLRILSIKILFSVIVGILVDKFLPETFIRRKNDLNISAFCKQERCKSATQTDKTVNIYKLAYLHTERISLFVFFFALVINAYFTFYGYNSIREVFINAPVLSKFFATFVGLIPGCYPSILLSQLYLDNIIDISTLMCGSFANTGLGLLVLYRINPNKIETQRILYLIFGISLVLGVVSGFVL